MPTRISKTAHQYAGRDLSAGDQFDIEPQHVVLLLALGRIEPEKGEVGYIEVAANDRQRKTRRSR